MIVRGNLRITPHLLCACLAFLVPFTAYILTMPPTVYGLDSAELTAGAYSLGIVHCPGAPTYMLLGHIMSKIPVGDVGFRLNLLSGLFGAATVLVVFLIARELNLSIRSALIAAGLLAFSFYFWVWAIVAELYAPHAFFSSTILLLLLQWKHTENNRMLMSATFLAGLACGNHTALVLLLPGYAWIALSAKPLLIRNLRLLAKAILFGFVGLAVFAYHPIRQAAHPQIDFVSNAFPEIDLATPSGLFWMVRGGVFTSLFLTQPLRALVGDGLHLLHLFISNFTPVGIVLAMIGCGALYRKNKSVGTALVLMFMAHSSFFLTYGAIDRFWMLSVSYVILAIWIAAGIDHAERLLQKRGAGFMKSLPAGVAASCACLLLVVNWPLLDLSRDYSARDFGLQLGSNMDKDAVFIGLWEQISILDYLQVVEGCRTDIVLHNAVFPDPERIRIIASDAAAAGRPLYVSNPRLAAFSDIVFSEIMSNNLYLTQIDTNTKAAQLTW